jgi:hypothetical protein
VLFVLFMTNNPFLRIKPLALASSHGRYMAAGEWPLHIILYYNRYKPVTVSLLNRWRGAYPGSGDLTFENAVRRFQKRNSPGSRTKPV